MYADVIVDTPTDPTKDYFTYQIPEKLTKHLKPGHLVKIPWGKKEITGIVKDIKTKSDLKNLKPVSELLVNEPILKDFQLKLLSWLSYYYASSSFDSLRLFLPDFPVNLDKINLRPTKETKAQKLILIPTFAQIPQALAKVKSNSSYLIYHQKMPKLKNFSIWQQVYNGEIELIVGLRSAIFLPFANLSEIILINEHYWSYKDERSPYHHCLAVAFKLSQIINAKLTIEDQTPSIELFHFAKALNKDTKFTLIQQKPKQKLSFQIIDMANERKAGNYSPISQDLANYLLLNRQKHFGPVLLFLNRKTKGGHVYCRVCKQATFVEIEPTNCPQCQSPDIVFYSLNLKLVVNELKKLIPKADYQIVTEGNKKPVPQAEITIATSAIFSSSIVSKFSQIAVISADTSLNLADFRSQEATFQMLWSLSLLPVKETNLPQIVIQTHNSNNPAIKYAINHDYYSFYQNEISERKSLSYPPFSRFVKLTTSHQNLQKAVMIVRNLYDLLSKNNDGKVEIDGPIQALVTLPRQNKWNIILKAEKRSDFDYLLKIAKNQSTIVVDPKDLL